MNESWFSIASIVFSAIGIVGWYVVTRHVERVDFIEKQQEAIRNDVTDIRARKGLPVWTYPD